MSTTQSTMPAGSQSSGPTAAASPDRGDVALLTHPVAQDLLQSTLPARLAYIARDGTPRVVPLQFHWTGEELVVNSWPDDPKVSALRIHPQVAVTIDSSEPPFRVLQVRGTATVTLVDGVSKELAAAAERYLGPVAGQEWVTTVMQLSSQSARIAILPAWADVLDFTTRLPGGMARRLAESA